jgi:hypothetical protein
MKAEQILRKRLGPQASGPSQDGAEAERKRREVAAIEGSPRVPFPSPSSSTTMLASCSHTHHSSLPRAGCV